MFPDSDPVAPPIDLLVQFQGVLGTMAIIGFVVIAVGVLGAVLTVRAVDPPAGAGRLSMVVTGFGIVLALVGGLPWLYLQRAIESGSALG